MAAELVMSEEAEQDIDDAFAWYERQRRDLGDDFLDAVGRCIRSVCANPEMHQRVHGDGRRALVRRFPYAVFYEIIEGRVLVHGVFHTSRDPDVWKERLG